MSALGVDDFVVMRAALIREHRRQEAGRPVVDEPVTAPVPLVAVPEEAAHT